MIKVQFYYLTEDYINQIIDRFKIDYPNCVNEYNNTEEELSFYDEQWSDIDEIDNYFLCEEICRDYEIYCSIIDTEKQDLKEFYYDESDDWTYGRTLDFHENGQYESEPLKYKDISDEELEKDKKTISDIIEKNRKT